MSLNEDIEKIRKKKLGLDTLDTNKIYNDLLNYYKKNIIDKPREVRGYTIDIAISNMNNYSKLGKIESLYSIWGDNYYIDFNNSAFIQNNVNKDGDIESFEEIQFNDISELKEIKKISFSLKDIIELCKRSNINVKLFAKDDNNYITTLEIIPYEAFKLNNNVDFYIKSMS